MRKRVYAVLIYSLLAVFLLIFGLWFASDYMLDYSLCAERNAYDVETAFRQKADEYPWQREWLDSLHTHRVLQDISIRSHHNGALLHAVYMPSPVTTDRCALLVHGYGNTCLEMLPIAYIYHHLLGMNVLMPDLYAHGLSQGDHINMGWHDRWDVLQWSSVADSVFGGDTQLVLHGISMGAATVMMASGEETLPCVQAIVEDCGYTSVWDEFSGELGVQFHLPDFPLMYTTSRLCRSRYGWSFQEASSLESVGRCRLPMLFIHGDQDTFVPTWMVYRLYAAKSQPKRLWISSGSKHARSYADNPDEYTRKVISFVNEYMPSACSANTFSHE
ncbi:MAG: alpha/beta hydrolase [Bacteroidaceae bacterium]